MLDLIKRECLSNATLFWKNRRSEGIKMLIKIENMFLVSKTKGLLQLEEFRTGEDFWSDELLGLVVDGADKDEFEEIAENWFYTAGLNGEDAYKYFIYAYVFSHFSEWWELKNIESKILKLIPEWVSNIDYTADVQAKLLYSDISNLELNEIEDDFSKMICQSDSSTLEKLICYSLNETLSAALKHSTKVVLEKVLAVMSVRSQLILKQSLYLNTAVTKDDSDKAKKELMDLCEK